MKWMHFTKLLLTGCLVLGVSIKILSIKQLAAANNPQPKHVLFVNQVRGEECCDPGNADALNQQLIVFAKYKLPATFALRYDALTPKFLDGLKNGSVVHEIAAFLEITPSLATDAKVHYEGDAQNWFRAKYSYLIGYSPEDRIKLIDVYMHRFKSQLDSYPKTTVAWMIDPLSLTYLAEKYGVTAHEITREQWGTDSYTLYGGPPHYPYYPSQNWALVPSSQQSTMPLIFRQTISDPLKNYGDFTSTFTSQPNDYVLGGNDFDYFRRLIDQTLSQPGNDYAIGVLGLENSMDDIFQKEFLKQIEYISNLSLNDVSIKVITADKLHDSMTKNTTSIISGKDLVGKTNAQAWWITSNTYRLRIRYDGDNLMINDIRLYDDSMTDPYLNEASSYINGMWVVPFLLDSSRINTEYAQKNPKPGTILKSLLTLNPFWSQANSQHFFEPGASPDLEKTSPALYLPKPDKSSSFSLERANSVISFKYTSKKNPQTLIFFDDSFQLPLKTQISGLASTNFFDLNQSSEIISIPPIKLESMKLSWIDSGDTLFGLAIDENSETWELKPYFKGNINWNSTFEHFAYAFNPEAHAKDLDIHNTVLYAHNHQGLAGSNPVRFILQGFDANNLPVPVRAITVNTKKDSSISVELHKPTQFNGGWWIDLSSQSSGVKDIQFNFDGYSRSAKAYFIENCSVHLKTCLSNPFQGMQFLALKLSSKIKSLLD